MEFMSIDLSEEVLAQTAPPQVASLMHNDHIETLIQGGFEEDSLICYAVFSHPVMGSVNDTFLEYLYTIPEKREEGCCSQLLSHCKRDFLRREIKFVTSKYYVSYENALDYNEFMENRGFVPLNLTTRLLYYPIDDLERPGSMQMVVDNLDKLPPIADIESVGEIRVQEFLKDKGLEEFSPEEIDYRYSRFYMNGKMISAALVASPLDKDSLYISGVYLDDLAKQKNMFLTLFSACIESAKKDMGEKMDVYFEVADEDTYQGLLRIFIPPEKEYLVMEHLLPLMMEEG